MSNMVKMNAKEDQICRLCLKVARDEYEIDEIVKQMFEMLLIKLDLNVTEDPIICHDCMVVAKKCLNFKSTCIDTEDFILSSTADGKKVQRDIRVIYQERERVQTFIGEGLNICRFCMTRLETNNFVSLDTLMNGSLFEMLSEHIEEMDFNTIENPIICAHCRENLDGYFKFVQNCVDIEEKIKRYCEEKGTNSKGQVKLENVLLSMFRDILEYPEKCSQTSNVQQDHSESTYPEGNSELIKQEELDIKDEEIDLNNISFKNLSQSQVDKFGDMFNSKELKESSDFPTNSSAICTNETKQTITSDSDLIKNGSTSKADKCMVGTSEVKQQRVLRSDAGLCKGSSEPKQESGVNRSMSAQNTKSDPQSYPSFDRGDSPMYKCSLCTYECEQKCLFNSHIFRVHTAKKFQCKLCAHKTKKRSDLKRHMLVHKDVSEVQMHKCSLCTFETKRSDCLKTHMLVHKDKSELKMYKCASCAYATNRKSGLRAHVLVHKKDVSEIKMYKCPSCTYEARLKDSLKKHILIHKDVSEVKISKCSLCPYQCRQSGNLKKHMNVHQQGISKREVQKYKCSLCTFGTKHRASLSSHMLIHKDSSEIKTYKCSLCTYEAKRKNNLKVHMLVHKDASQIEIFTCSLCTYKTKLKGDLKKHMTLHEDKIFRPYKLKCSFCAFEANCKLTLMSHELVHKDVSEIEMYRCSVCDHTTNKNSLKRHMMVHKDVSKTEMHKCSLCPYESKYVRNLKRHMLVHEDVSKVEMLKCASCDFETKHRDCIRRHVRIHKNSEKRKIKNAHDESTYETNK